MVSAMCDASQCSDARCETTWSFHGVARLRRCAVAPMPVPFVPLVTHLRATAGVQRSETRIAEKRGGEKERVERKRERMVEKVLSNAVVPPSVLRNTIILVTSLTPSIFRVSSSWTVRSYNSPWHRTEVGDLLQRRVRANRLQRGEVSDRAVLRLLTTPNRFRFEHDSYIKG